MNSGFSIGKIFGINIRIDWSWLLILALISWSLSVSFAQLHPSWNIITSIWLAIVAAVLFFASVLLHEVAHSVVARSRGIPVRNITLFLFGGVSNIQREPASPLGELLITVVGPLTSIILGVVFLVAGAVSVYASGLTLNVTAQAISRIGLVSTLFIWLGFVNILVGFFNLIPGFPLDGGRILRSLLWAATDNMRKATRWASGVGEAVAWLFILMGIGMIFGLSIPLLGGGLVNGLWFILIGWFLYNAAVQSYRQTVVQDLLQDIPVSRMMQTNVPSVPYDLPVDAFVNNHIMTSDDEAFLVMNDGDLMGLVTLDDVRKLPKEERSHTLVRDIMVPSNKLLVIAPTEDAAEGLARLRSEDVRQLPVVSNGSVIGILRRQDILRWLQLQSELNKDGKGRI